MAILNSIRRDDKHKSEEIKEKEFYETPILAVKILEQHLKEQSQLILNNTILDPCCGKEAISKVFEDLKYNVTKFDKFPYSTRIEEKDFLTTSFDRKWDITVMNPPYTSKKEFIDKALIVTNNVYVFLPLQVTNYIDFTSDYEDTSFYHGKIVIYPKMILTNSQNYKQGGMTAYAWFHFSTKEQGPKKYEYFYDMRKFKC